jgi:hypothetical protein
MASPFVECRDAVLRAAETPGVDPEHRDLVRYVRRWFEQAPDERCLAEVSDSAEAAVWLPYVLGAERVLVVFPSTELRRAHERASTDAGVNPVARAAGLNQAQMPLLAPRRVVNTTLADIASASDDVNLVRLVADGNLDVLANGVPTSIDLVIAVNGRHGFSNDAWAAMIERCRAKQRRLVILTEDMDGYELAEFYRQAVPGLPAYFGAAPDNEPLAKRRHCATCCCDVD